MPGGRAALFGFFAVPAQVRKRVPEEVLRSHCRAQFTRLFGPQAALPKAEFIKDWAQDPYTATPTDLGGDVHHASPVASVSTGPWHGRLTGIAAEWPPQFPGYVAGAIEAASLGVQTLLELAEREGNASGLRRNKDEGYIPRHAGQPTGNSGAG
jgi:monoamine oxidase